MAGHNGRVKGTSSSSFSGKTIRTADIERAQAAREAELRGSPELRAALRPGRLFRLTTNVVVSGKVGPYDELSATLAAVPADHPRRCRMGALMMLIALERVSIQNDGGTLRRPCYTFIPMGSAGRCVLKALTLIEPV